MSCRLTTRRAAPLLNIFGGKITTYRKLAEAALDKIAPGFPLMGAQWTRRTQRSPAVIFRLMPFDMLVSDLQKQFPFLDERWARRLVRAYGSDAFVLLGNARSVDDLGRDFGATITEAELRWLMDKEFARTAEDVALAAVEDRAAH